MWGAGGLRAEAKINLWKICDQNLWGICEKSVRCEGVCKGICERDCEVWWGLWGDLWAELWGGLCGDLPAAIWNLKIFVISLNEMWGVKEMWGEMKWGSTGGSRRWKNAKGSASGPVRERSATRHTLLTCTHPDCSTSHNLFTYTNEDPDFPTDFSQISHSFSLQKNHRLKVKIIIWASPELA